MDATQTRGSILPPPPNNNNLAHHESNINEKEICVGLSRILWQAYLGT